MRVRAGDVRLFFEVVGTQLRIDGPRMEERPALVVLHGGPGADHTVFRPDLDELADVAQVLYLDHRGNGRSERSDPSRWNLVRWADDVEAFCDALELGHPFVLGASFGGIVAMLHSIRHPTRAAGLVLVTTTARTELERTLDAFERVGGPHAREVARRRHEEPTAEALAEYLRVCFPLYSRRGMDPERMARMPINEEVRAHFATHEQMTFDLTAGLRAIRCPTLVVAGEYDPMTPVESSRDLVAEIGANARLEVVPDAGHMLLHDAPGALVALVREFVSGGARAAAPPPRPAPAALSG
jgi:proline iminopeptidase